MLKLFVDKSPELYTEKFVVYNTHSLTHITNDARHFKCSLNEVSAFPYENHLQFIKQLVRNGGNPIFQVTKRIKEKEYTENWKRSFIYFHVITLHYMSLHYISSTLKNSCFLFLNELYAFVRKKWKDGKLVCNILDQSQTENFFFHPCESKLINIAFVKRERHLKLRLLEKIDLYKKVVCLPYEGGYVLIPTLPAIWERLCAHSNVARSGEIGYLKHIICIIWFIVVVRH